MNLILSCEHGGNVIPEAYQHLFTGADEELNTHLGYDIGAFELYEAFKQLEPKYAKANKVSRLLVDVNRSLYRQSLFSDYTKTLFKGQRLEILERYYYKYRRPFEHMIQQLWEREEHVLHLSIHSFTPILNDEIRLCDIGLLYHPQRKHEKDFCQRWKSALNSYLPHLRVRYNYPYSGRPDGHVRFFRDREEEKYMGIELELNQKHAGNYDVINGIVAGFKKGMLKV